jgi:hypothetical protein
MGCFVQQHADLRQLVFFEVDDLNPWDAKTCRHAKGGLLGHVQQRVQGSCELTRAAKDTAMGHGTIRCYSCM